MFFLINILWYKYKEICIENIYSQQSVEQKNLHPLLVADRAIDKNGSHLLTGNALLAIDDSAQC